MVAVAVAVLSAGCGDGNGRPTRLLDGRPAARFDPVADSVITSVRLVQLGDRADECLSDADRAAVTADTAAVERIGVEGESLTFASRDHSLLYACDGGIDPAGEGVARWCHTVVGEVVGGQLLDPRLDVICRDRERRPLAYRFVVPVVAARWIGVRESGYVELYEVVGDLPVRVVTTRGIDTGDARATFEITQYDAEGHELVSGRMEASVAG